MDKEKSSGIGIIVILFIIFAFYLILITITLNYHRNEYNRVNEKYSNLYYAYNDLIVLNSPNERCSLTLNNSQFLSRNFTEYLKEHNINLRMQINGSHLPVNIYGTENRVLGIGDIDGYGYIYIANTNSMLPTIAEGNWVIWQDYDKFKVKYRLSVGDIIRFKYEYKTVVHRIIEIRKDTILTQGDNNLYFETINEADILSVVMGTLYK